MAESSNTQQYTVNHADRDGTDFKLPGDNPGEAPFSLDDTSESAFYHWYVHIDNGWDADIDATIEGSHSLDSATNDTLDSPTNDGATETISSGSVDFFDGTTNHAQIQLDISPLADPTSGDLVVTMERRKS
jgi:hypothetical protein